MPSTPRAPRFCGLYSEEERKGAAGEKEMEGGKNTARLLRLLHRICHRGKKKKDNSVDRLLSGSSSPEWEREGDEKKQKRKAGRAAPGWEPHRRAETACRGKEGRGERKGGPGGRPVYLRRSPVPSARPAKKGEKKEGKKGKGPPLSRFPGV